MIDNWIYSNTNDDKARFLLGEKGNKTLICIGINPSTARPDNLDRTLTSVKRFSKDLGYDSWLMLNLYPQRATDPNNLHNEINKKYPEENLIKINSIIRNGNYDIWAAWGNLIKKRKYLFSCLDGIYNLFKDYNIKWHTIGDKTKAGHPHHPLYLNKKLKLESFNIREYLIKQNIH
jgi:hypothetical protein